MLICLALTLKRPQKYAYSLSLTLKVKSYRLYVTESLEVGHKERPTSSRVAFAMERGCIAVWRAEVWNLYPCSPPYLTVHAHAVTLSLLIA